MVTELTDYWVARALPVKLLTPMAKTSSAIPFQSLLYVHRVLRDQRSPCHTETVVFTCRMDCKRKLAPSAGNGIHTIADYLSCTLLFASNFDAREKTQLLQNFGTHSTCSKRIFNV